LCRFVAILDPPFTKIHGGPIQWGWISAADIDEDGKCDPAF
jgi:uncharacterized protein YcsI (UPF0317 family)